MTPRSLGLLASLLTAIVLVAVSPNSSHAQNEKFREPQPVFQSEGRNPYAFNVSCSTSAWTIVVTSDTIARSTFIESISSNTNNVCLLPGPTVPTVAVSSQCTTATQGPELVPSSSLTDYSRAAWYCASSSGTVSNILKGYRTRDVGDAGLVGNKIGQ